MATWIAVDLDRYTDRYAGRILPGVTVAGLDMSGATRAEALARVDALHEPERARRLTLRLVDAHWETSLGELGFRSDAAERVDEALAVTREQSTWSWFLLRWERRSLSLDLPVTTEVPRSGRRELVRRIAAEARREAVDAELTWDRSRPEISPEARGRRVHIRETMANLAAAIETPRVRLVTVATRTLEPKVTTADFAQILFLRQDDHELDVYLDGQLARTFTVAVGTGDYPTPTGRYEVTLKRYLPTWVNPDPYGWGRTMPARIGPGPDNPLGVRALNWSAPGAIRFHGTADEDSLGTDASHGCVRLSNPDVIELYDLVDEGAVIISTA